MDDGGIRADALGVRLVDQGPGPHDPLVGGAGAQQAVAGSQAEDGVPFRGPVDPVRAQLCQP